MKLEIGIPVTVLDLASAVKGESGTFICQNNGQDYILEAQVGHSITFGPFPFGRRVQEIQNGFTMNPAWTVTKLTHQFVSTEFTSREGTLRTPQTTWDRGAAA